MQFTVQTKIVRFKKIPYNICFREVSKCFREYPSFENADISFSFLQDLVSIFTVYSYLTGTGSAWIMLTCHVI